MMPVHRRTKLEVIRALEGKELCVVDIWAVTGLNRHTIARVLKALMESKVVHISDWTVPVSSRVIRPIYALGDGKDAPKPVVDGDYIRRRQRLWRRQDRMKKRIEANKGNPFGPIMAQVVKKGSGGRPIA